MLLPQPLSPPPYLEAACCIVIIVASWIDVVIVIAFRSRPESTDRSSGGRRRGRHIGGNRVGVITALPWGDRPAGQASKTILSLLSLSQITFLASFFHARRTPKKSTISNRLAMYNSIVHGRTIADLEILQQAWVDRDRRFATMIGGVDFHLAKILALVCCSSVCFFLVLRVRKKRCSHQKKYILAGTLGLDPLLCTPCRQVRPPPLFCFSPSPPWHKKKRDWCCNLGDLASNLGVGCPLARVTGWAKKVGSIKVFREN